jgi:hypothetical protein
MIKQVITIKIEKATGDYEAKKLQALLCYIARDRSWLLIETGINEFRDEDNSNECRTTTGKPIDFRYTKQ